ncbi:MAG: hypothetical protein WCT35_08985 [Sideroxydans sp.]|jgi:hypothetical protein
MKKLLVLAAALSIAQPAMAGTINSLQSLGQADFRSLSEDLGSALSHKSISPAESLGVTGFDVGVDITQTTLAKTKDSNIWTAIGTGNKPSNLYVPKLHIAKGLPMGLDIGGFVSTIPTTGITLMGAEVKYDILSGNVALPAVAVRGAFTKLSGVNQLSFDTKSLDVSVSKGFAMFTPYAGIGQVWVNSKANVTGVGNVNLSESFTQQKVFIGGNLNMGFTNIALEMDKTGAASSTSLKLGFRF